MSSLRGRKRDTSWQWLLVGLVLGMGCASVFCLGAYAANLITFNFLPGQQAALNTTPTVEVMVITATPEPVTPSLIPPTVETVVETTAAPAVPTQQQPILIPSPTAFTSISTPIGGGAVNTPLGTMIGVPAIATTEQPIGAAPGIGTPNQPQVNVTFPAAETPIVSNEVEPSPLVDLPGGAFQMGTTANEANLAIQDCVDRDQGTACNPSLVEDSFPPRTVSINPYSLERFEVSHAQYIAFLNRLGPGGHVRGCGGQPCVAVQGAGTGASNPNSFIRFDGTTYSVTQEFYNERPVVFVTWYGARAYCDSIGRRLPTEAEWEFAARYDGGENRRLYPWGDAWDATRARTSRPQPSQGPESVDSFPNGVTATGIFNMAGNVAEWVTDWYDPNLYKNQPPQVPIDPQGPPSGQLKVTRGGSWDTVPLFARTVHRGDFQPNQALAAVGFRCAAGPAGSLSPNLPPTGPTQAAPTPAVPGAATSPTPGSLPSGTGG